MSLPLPPHPFPLWSLRRNWETSWEITSCLFTHTPFGYEVQVMRNERLLWRQVFANSFDALDAAKREREQLILAGWIAHPIGTTRTG